MSYEEILETSDDGKFRVKLVLDECADEPYDDGQSPLMRIDTGYYGNVRDINHVMATGRPTNSDERIEEAARRWGGPNSDDFRYFEKYLRAYYGTREIETWSSGSYWYITYDTSAWRKYIGYPDGEKNRGMPDHLVNMDEYRAWCEGECYGYVIEKNTLWRKDENPDETMESWEDVDSCWGFYGEYSREAALEAFNREVSANVPARPGNQTPWAVELWQRFLRDLHRMRRTTS
jgi:hypothetical protein